MGHDLIEGAKTVAEKALTEFAAELVLTFAGPSALFVGLTVTMLSIGDIVRTKMFTAVLVKGKLRKVPVGFEKVPAGNFTILVPEEVVRDPSRKIVVIDDSITSGGAMEALRQFFKRKEFNFKNVQFACCVCYDGLRARAGSRPRPRLPEIVGILPNAEQLGFIIPWGKNSYTFCEI